MRVRRQYPVRSQSPTGESAPSPLVTTCLRVSRLNNFALDAGVTEQAVLLVTQLMIGNAFVKVLSVERPLV